MKHLRTISRLYIPSKGQVSALESVIMLIMGVFVGDWDNYSQVSQNLRKFYEKSED